MEDRTLWLEEKTERTVVVEAVAVYHAGWESRRRLVELVVVHHQVCRPCSRLEVAALSPAVSG